MDEAGQAHLFMVDKLDIVKSGSDALSNFFFSIVEMLRATLKTHVEDMHVPEQDNLFFGERKKEIRAGQALEQSLNFL